MRLTQQEIDAIKAAARETFGRDAVVRLFGSRVRDDLKGGDIDLHVETEAARASFDYRYDFSERLAKYLGDRKIDVVVSKNGGPLSGIAMIAQETGIVL